MSQPSVFTLPDVGEGLTSADVLAWLVREGDTVELNAPLVQIETEKAVVEIPSPYAGIVAQLHAAEGDTVAVGSPLVTFDVDGPVEATPPPPERQAVLVGYGVSPDDEVVRRRRRRTVAKEPRRIDQPTNRSPKATPPVRLFAKRQGIDLTTVVGTGRDGVITRGDIEAAIAGTSTAVPSLPTATRPFNGRDLASWTSGEREERIPVKGVVKSMADAMVRSAFQAPHACVWRRVDATRTVDVVRGLNERWEGAGVKISPMAIAIAGLLEGARRFPGINSTFDAENNEIIVKRFVNMGVAVDTPRGLIVPNIKDADQLNLRELAEQLRTLVSAARAGTTAPSDLSGTTLTITNVGPFDVDGAMAILPPGTGAIVAMGRVGPAPWVDGDRVVVRDVVELSLSFDHRMIDGALASQFLAFVGDFLSDPAPSLIDLMTA